MQRVAWHCRLRDACLLHRGGVRTLAHLQRQTLQMLGLPCCALLLLCCFATVLLLPPAAAGAKDVALRFQDGIVLGVVDVSSGAAIVNPPSE